jgi:hypothetical protein
MEMTAWLDANCRADGWAMTRAGVRGVLNDAGSIYFLDATLATAFVARWCRVQDRDGWRRVQSRASGQRCTGHPERASDIR